MIDKNFLFRGWSIQGRGLVGQDKRTHKIKGYGKWRWTHVDPSYDPGVVVPVRPIEEAFTPLDVSKQPDAGFQYPAVGAVLTYNQSKEI